MDAMPFVVGLLTGAAIVVTTGFLREAGKDAYSWVKNKLNPPDPDPVAVPSYFEPTLFEPGECAWVSEAKRLDRQHAGYTDYPHPANGAPCFRMKAGSREYLMAKPDARLREEP